MTSKPESRHEESVAAPDSIQLWEVPAEESYALALHGGAGGRIAELADDRRRDFEAGLTAAYRAGEQILRAGGSALDAVCATVEVMEDDPLFNAGRGAALTSDGHAELDAAVMSGDGHAGAVAAARYARNPVRLARAVMERSEHVLLVSPPADLVKSWDLDVVDPGYFVTEARRLQLARLQERGTSGPRHGTVGAVARDSSGRIAAATSTGGMSNQAAGRIGDTPIIGAGTYARDGIAAISCTGHGEAFIRGVVGYDIAARIRYLGSGLAEAVAATIAAELTGKDSSGGLVSIDPTGRIVVAHNSPSMFAAFTDKGSLIIHT
ncbi:MAG: isoaspartyl peptidase/L-asparaginase [Microlunatus sp.]|nr:isoaspartyl peptidase/L-asparaginase [Microlunatus sp.]